MPIIRSWQLRDMFALPTNRTWPPSCSHGTYQHKAITSRSRQFLMMGTWLPETCWATIRREQRIQKVASSWFSYPPVQIVIQMLSQANWALSVNWMSGIKCSRAYSRTLAWSCGQRLYILQVILSKTFTVQNFPHMCPSCKSCPGKFCVYTHLCFAALLP